MGSSQSGWWLARPAAHANFPLITPIATSLPNEATHVA